MDVTRKRRTRSTLGAKVAENDNGLFALLDRTTLYSSDKLVLRVERASLASEAKTLLAGDFCDSAAWREIALQDTVGDFLSALHERDRRA